MPSQSDPKWAALIQGRLEYKFTNAPASMLLFQLKTDFKRDGSPGSLAKSINTLHAFCSKYQHTFLKADLKAIFN